MDWQTDPYLARLEKERRARNNVIRTAVIWMPLFLLVFAGLVWAVFDRVTGGGTSTWFLVGVLGIISFLFGFQGIQALRDLIGGERTVTGQVTRRWTRRDSFVLKSHYIRLDNKQIFLIDDAFHGDVREGDLVEVRHYPHTSVVIDCERLEQPGDKEEDEDEQRRVARERMEAEFQRQTER